MKHGTIVLGLVILLLASCYLPQNPADLDGKEPVEKISVTTDKSRDQGVYVNEKGERFDIVSEEGPDGEVVRCVEALDIVRVGSGDAEGSKSLGAHGPVKALILGRRHDGYPGVWEVSNDDTVLPVSSNESGEKNSKAGDSCEVEWLVHGFFGWQYHVEFPFVGPDSKGGFIFVGYAENTRGIDFGGEWKIDEGATVAVYWRLDKKKNGHFHLSRARIIGEPNENYMKWKKDDDKEFHHWGRYRHSMFVHFLLYLFDSVKFFFLDSFDTYLVDALEAEYDSNQDVYLVQGHVEGIISVVDPVTKEKETKTVEEIVAKEKKLLLGTATITPDGEITITSKIDDGSGNGGGNDDDKYYERIVIEAYSPYGGGEPSVEVTLMQDTDIAVEGDEDPYAIRVQMSDLAEGTYYIRITSNAATDQPYALRVLDLATGEAKPDAIIPGLAAINYSDEPYEPDDDNPDRNSIDIGNSNYVNRYFDIADSGEDNNVDTVDWLKLEL
jgi:hypothetical protein